MATLLNQETGKPEDVPDEHAGQAYLSGKYSLPAGPVSMMTPDGKPVAVPYEHAADAFRSGFKYESPEAAKARQEEERKESEYGEGLGNTLKAGAEGFGRGLLPGIAPMIEKGFGVSEEGMRERKERHGIASTAGELGGIGTGIAAGGAIAGGLGAAAEGAGALAEGGRALEATGAAVDAATGAERATAMADAGATALGKRLAKGAAINAAYGVGNDVNEDQLGESQVTAQKLISHIGLNALLGAGSEGLFALGERAVPPILEKASQGLDALKDTTGKVFDKLSSMASGAPKDLVRSVRKAGPVAEGALDAEKAAAKAATGEAKGRAMGAVRDSARDLADTTNQAVDAAQSALNEANGKARPEEVGRLLFAPESVEPAKAGMQKAIDAGDAALKEIKANPDSYTYKAPIAALEKNINALREAQATVKTGPEAFGALNTAKRNIDNALKYDGVATASEMSSLKAVGQVNGVLRSTLEDTAHFGAAGSRQAEFNEAQRAYIASKREVLQTLGHKELTDEMVLKTRVAASRVENMLKGAVTDSNTTLRARNAFEKLQESSRSLIEQMGKTYENTSLGTPDFGELRGLLDKANEAKSAGIENVNAAKNVARVEPSGPATDAAKLAAYGKPTVGLSQVAGAGYLAHAAGLAGGPLAAGAAAAAGLAGALRNPAHTIETLGRLGGVVDKVTSRIGSGVAAIMRNAPAREAGVAGASLGTLGSANFSAAHAYAKRSDDSFEKRAGQIASLATNPTLLANTLNRKTPRMADAAPQLTIALHKTATVGVQYLNQAMPKSPLPPSLLGRPSDWKPSEQEVAAFERKVAAVDDPLSILTDAKHGLLMPDSLEAVQAVHPDLLQEIRQHTLEQLSDHPNKNYSFQQKQQLSMLLGTPVDASTNPLFTAAMQAPAAPSDNGGSSQQKSSGVKMSQKGLGKLNFANASQPASAGHSSRKAD